MEKLIYHKKKLYKFSEHMDDLTRRASSNFSTEIERTEALTEICLINNFLEGIFRNAIHDNFKRMGSQHKESY